MINLIMNTQPNDETCGPTCLHAIYNYYGLDIALPEVVKSVEKSLSGGTLSPLLGKNALLHGFDATIYINNMTVFDPTWFKHTESPKDVLLTKLKSQLKFKQSKKIMQFSHAFIDFIELGGTVRFQTLDVAMLKSYFDQNIPILTGLNVTYLYRTARECFTSDGHSFYDDIQGDPCGHFVVLCGYDEHKKRIVVADPYRLNPFSGDNHYKVSSTRLINAILLGVHSYDANLLIITKKTAPELPLKEN